MSSPVLTFADLRSKTLIRTPLDDPYGRAWQAALGSVMDEQLRRTVWASRAGWPDWAPSDGLLYISQERGLEQARVLGDPSQLETEPVFRSRLRGAWELWNLAGSQTGHINEFSWLGLPNVSVHRRKEWSQPPEQRGMSQYVKAFQRSVWSQFDVLIEQPHPWKPVFWNGVHWGAFTWGSTALPADIDQMRRFLRKFRSGHDTPTWIVVSLDSGSRVWGAFRWGVSGVGSGYNWSTGPTPFTTRWLCGESHWSARGLL